MQTHNPLIGSHSRAQGGSVMAIVVFSLAILLPVMMVYSKWMMIHRKGTTQARVHIKEFYAGNAALDVGRIRFQTTPPVWVSTAPTTSYTVRVDSGTVVTTQIRHVGTR